MQRMITSWVAVCLIFTFTPSCNKDATPEAVTPPSAPVATKKPLPGSSSVELPTSATSTPGPGEALETPPPTAPAEPAAALDPLSDAQIVGVTEVASSSEVDQARIARARATQSDTKQFAAMLIIHDEEAQREQAKLGIPSGDSPVGEQLRADGLTTIQKLRSAVGDEFDRVYINSQVDEQRKMLTLIDSQLLLDAKDGKVKAYLEKIKSKIQLHLQRAEMQQQALTTNVKPGFVEAEAKPTLTRNSASR